MLRIDPRVEGPPDANTAVTSVESELTVYVPGRFAWPTTNTWIERSLPSVAVSWKLRNVRPNTVLRYAGRSLAFTPATLITPTLGTLIEPSRLTTALKSTSIWPQARIWISSPGPMT